MARYDSFRVLLVDDDSQLLESMAAVLSDRFVVHSVTSGVQALNLVKREPYHVVCADWQMPGMNGVEFFQQIEVLNLPEKPCFVLVTAYTNELLARVPHEERKSFGMLRKPFSPEQLVERVNQFAGVAQMKRSTAALTAALGERK